MAIFGAPMAHEDHAQRAYHAALHLGAQLRRYVHDLRRERGLSFSVRMGLNSGDVVVGDRRRPAHGFHGSRAHRGARAADGAARRAGSHLPHGAHRAARRGVLPAGGARAVPREGRARPGPRLRARGRGAAGRGGVLDIAAEAGVGKSRLCFEFTERARARGVVLRKVVATAAFAAVHGG